MSVVDLVTRCTSESCHMSIRLSMCGEQHYDNTQFLHKLQTKICGAYNVTDQQCFSKYNFVKKKRSLVRIPSIFANVFV